MMVDARPDWRQKIDWYVVVPVVLSIVLLGCSVKSSGNVVRQPLKVSKRYIEDLKDGEKNPLATHEEALTDWQFGCKTELDFEVVDKYELGDEVMATVKLTSASMVLEAPVTVWVSKSSGSDVIEHEMAHVDICKRVYAKAETIAKDSVKKAMARTYQASGKTLKLAVRSALAMANKEICQYYHLTMVEKVNRVSEIFDSIEHNIDKPQSEIVDMAFEKYKVVKSKAN